MSFFDISFDINDDAVSMSETYRATYLQSNNMKKP